MSILYIQYIICIYIGQVAKKCSNGRFNKKRLLTLAILFRTEIIETFSLKAVKHDLLSTVNTYSFHTISLNIFFSPNM